MEKRSTCFGSSGLGLGLCLMSLTHGLGLVNSDLGLGLGTRRLVNITGQSLQNYAEKKSKLCANFLEIMHIKK